MARKAKDRVRGRPKGSGLYATVIRCNISSAMDAEIRSMAKLYGFPNEAEAIRAVLRAGLDRLADDSPKGGKP